MINLLPPQLKEDYGYARRNSSMLHILSAFGIGIVGLVLIAAAGIFYLQRSASTYAIRADQVESSLEAQNQEAVEKEVQDISNSLKLAVQVLSKEVLFSQLIKQLAVVTPSNVSLSGVNINEFGGGIDVTAEAIDYDAASQLQINLADPANKIFAKADIVSISCESEPSASTKYPCKVVIRALFSINNPFLFINGEAGGS